MTKGLFVVKKGNAIVSAKQLDRKSVTFSKKSVAKKARDKLQGERPANPDISTEWKYHISPGPDHWRNA